MKIVYCIHSLFNSAGMERIITEKANSLSSAGNDVFIVTADQQNRPLFYPLKSQIKHYDLDINYSENNTVVSKFISYFGKRKKHEIRLSNLLNKLQPDIVISTMGNEFLFLHKLKDGSKKVLEIHFAKNYRLMYRRSFLWNLIDHYRTWQEARIAAKYDKFVVLTNEDLQNWTGCHNIISIPNYISFPDIDTSIGRQGKVLIAVGRLSYQKGYDRLIAACALIKNELKEWNICIYGDGELKGKLENDINFHNLSHIIKIMPVTSEIEKVYQQSNGLLLTSRFEGLPMVLLEAMSYGTPAIAFDCPCGPLDVIEDNEDGLLVKNGDVVEYSKAILRFIKDVSLREKLSLGARKKAKKYSKEVVIAKWIALFDELVKRK